MNIEFELDDIRFDLANVLRNADHSPFYNSVGKILKEAVASNFKVEGAYFQRGTSWMPLAPSTVAFREKHNLTPINILERRGGDAGLSGSINYTANRNFVEIGTNLDYAKYLHFGTKYMPSRPIFPDNELPPEVIEDIADQYIRFITNLIK